MPSRPTLHLGRAVAFCALLVLAPGVFAKTYYLDVDRGNDAWSGEAPDPGATGVGPWQTLDKLRSVTLAAGDEVLLRCGQTWSGTLRPTGAGTADQPIRLGSYPASCADKPAISGYRTIPDHAWQLHQGSIYKASLPLNQIWNGSLETSIQGWKRYAADNSTVLAYSATCPDTTTGCLRATTGSVRQGNLVISPTFPLEVGANYVAEISVWAPARAAFGVLVRRNGPTWETLGLASSQGGSGTWKRVTLPFRATKSIANARLEVEFYNPSTSFYFKNASVRLAEQPTPTQLSQAGEPVNVAHHPNAGVDPTRPQSVYLLTAGASTVTTIDGKSVSPNVVVGDMKLPEGVSITPGINLHLRENGWRVDQHTVTGISGNRISIDPPTSYPMSYGKWGYYFTGALWMLDSPGEWFYDAAASTLYLWPADGQQPKSNVRYAALDTAIDLARARYISVDGLRIEGVRQGLELQDAVGIQLSNLDIIDTQDNAIRAIGAINSTIEGNRFLRIGGDAVHALYSTGLRVLDNDIVDNGVRWRNGQVANLPKTVYAAIRAGRNAVVSGNRIENAGYLGITSDNDSRIERNVVLNSCTVLNDCGGVVLTSGSYGSQITGNLFITSPGNTDGVYPTLPAHSAGLYFDEHVHDVVATGNTVVGHSYGAQVHNSWNITLEDNTFFGNTTNQLFVQEQRNAAFASGDVHDNLVRNNRFVSKDENNAVYLLSTRTTTYDYGRFEGNLYSAMLSPIVLVENQPGNLRTANTLPDWQAATNAGVPRNQDIGARVAAPLAGRALGLTGNTVLFNGDFSSGKASWYSASLAPTATTTVADCSPGPSRCLQINTGGGNAAAGTPRFSIENRWYRVSFDVRADRDNTPLWAVVRRAGTTSYAYLMPSSFGVTAGTAWKRYSFNFKSSDTVVANSAPGVLGARLDFEQMPAGRTVWLANVEMTPLNLSDGVGSLEEPFLLTNPGFAVASRDCPLRATQPGRCNSFIDFDTGTPVVWPVQLDPLASRVVFTQDLSLPDADQDGIADRQDRCVATPAGRTVNAVGCALGETPGNVVQ